MKRLLVPLALLAGSLVGIIRPAAAAGSEPGTVVTTATRSLLSTISRYGTAQRVVYWSTEGDGDPVQTSAVILRPRYNVTNKIVAWAHGAMGLADNCAPSNTNYMGHDDYAATVASYLQRGWTVAATDYTGLGTPGQHEYMHLDSEARSVIDSVRAAKNLYPTLSGEYVVTGHSQGGHAALGTGELASTYGVGLTLKGVIAMAPGVKLEKLAPTIVKDGIGLAVMALYGIADVYPEIVPSTILTAQALSKASVFNSGCVDAIRNAYLSFTPTSVMVGGVWPSGVLQRLADNNPGRRRIPVPTAIVHGTEDTLIPFPLAEQTVADYCALGGTPLEFYPLDGAPHSMSTWIISDAQQWIGDRFANRPTSSTC